MWARELADRAFEAFTYPIEGTDQRGIHWKGINDVMLATALAPEGLLVLGEPPAR